MNTEKLIAKGVARKWENGEALFNVESLHEHYEGINYHLVDMTEDGFIKSSDVFGDDIREIEVVVEEKTPYEESEEGTKGIVIRSLPEEDVDVLIAEANAQIEVIEPEVVEPEIVVPEVVVAETPAEETETEKQ